MNEKNTNQAMEKKPLQEEALDEVQGGISVGPEFSMTTMDPNGTDKGNFLPEETVGTNTFSVFSSPMATISCHKPEQKSRRKPLFPK